MEMDLNFAAF